MGRSSTTAAIGHNHRDLTEDEASALTIHHQLKIQAAQNKLAALMVDVKSARDAVNSQFKRLAADLGFTRKEFEAEVLSKLNLTDAQFLASEQRRDRLHRLAGLKEGEQIDLIDHVLKDTVDDALEAESQGYRAGRRADEPKPPAHIANVFITDWTRGYTRGQEVNAKAEAMAAEIYARPKPGEMAAAPEEETEEEDPADLDVIKAKAAKLKAEGWTEPTAGEANFEAAA